MCVVEFVGVGGLWVCVCVLVGGWVGRYVCIQVDGWVAGWLCGRSICVLMGDKEKEDSKKIR